MKERIVLEPLLFLADQFFEQWLGERLQAQGNPGIGIMFAIELLCSRIPGCWLQAISYLVCEVVPVARRYQRQ
ncbi:hypothetical protein D3C78_1718940 [compost metagenome]